jgi:hypothetical protein
MHGKAPVARTGAEPGCRGVESTSECETGTCDPVAGRGRLFKQRPFATAVVFAKMPECADWFARGTEAC